MTDAFEDAAVLDRYLGDPADPSSKMPTTACLAADRDSAFPQDAVDALDDWGLHRAYVPTAFGGTYEDPIHPMMLLRHVAGRDLTAAVAHGKTFLGAICAWVDGGDIAPRMAAIALNGDPVSWGLTEQGRGSDLLRSTTSWDWRTGRLDGAKWPINNATRGRALCVLARTREQLGPRSLSLVLADKEELGRSGLSYLPKVRTHGIRGADISGVEWRDATVGTDRLVGEEGHGLDLVLKALQVTRPTCTALSLGAIDQAVAAVLDFTTERIVRGRPLAELATVRADLGALAADALIAEVTALVGVRHIAVLPEEMNLVSACVKYVVPATVDDAFRRATSTLGARSQLPGTEIGGRFEKACRDHRIVGIFDGNSVVNLRTIINEFPAMAKAGSQRGTHLPLPPGLDPGRPSPGLDLSRLRLMTRAGSSLLAAVDELAAGLDAGASGPLRAALSGFRAAAARVAAEVAQAPRLGAPGAESFDLALRVAEVFAGAACLVVASGNARRTTLAGDDAWLAAALARVCQRIGSPLADASGQYGRLADRVLAHRRAGHRAVTLFEGWCA
jgi:alkylation response protein AidB-like acyl-CoA dehydrogenase